jgi:hypothetical protein
MSKGRIKIKKTKMKTAGIIALIILGVIGISVVGWAAGIAIGIFSLPFTKLSAQVQANHDIQSQTYNANNILYNYHWFQETAGQLQAYQQNLTIAQQAVTDFKTNAKGDMSTWSYAETTEYARLNAVAQGIAQEYNSLAQEYNAKAGEADRGIFKDGLPLFFSLKPY